MNDHPSGDNASVSPSSEAVVARRIPERRNLSLQQALGCLDLKLEDELTRFRAKQAERTNDRQSMVASAATWEQQSGDETDGEIITAEIVRSALANPTITESVKNSAPPNREMPQSGGGGFIIIDGIDPPRANLTAITHVNDELRSPHSTGISTTHGSLDLNFSPRGEITSFHHEYSASSQQLLRQIQSGYTAPVDGVGTQTPPAPIPPKRKLLTPLKIGSLAVACVIAGGAAYTYFNPAILAPLTASKPIAPATTGSALGKSIQSPNLAANEFTELNLNTLNTIKLPIAVTANPRTATNAIANPTTAGAPVAIPYRGMNPAPVPPTTIVAQPRLADSLIRSLLPPNFHISTKQTRYPASQPGLRR